MKKTRKPASDRKREIVDTAIDVAGDIGPDRLTVQHLADKIGISQPAIFRHFPTKADIWQGVATRIGDIMEKNVAKKTTADLPACEQLRALVLAQFKFIQTTPAVPAILFSRELHRENEPLRAIFAKLMAGRHRVFKDLAQRAISDGDFRAELDPEQAAFLILSLIQGLAMRWSLAKRGFDLVTEGGNLYTLQEMAFRTPSATA